MANGAGDVDGTHGVVFSFLAGVCSLADTILGSGNWNSVEDSIRLVGGNKALAYFHVGSGWVGSH